jgi:tRNA-2-methylthio-N6-dimethylallyladenosine synthase
MSGKVYIESMGCQMNVSDTERAETRLRSQGFNLTSNPDDADFVILNSCSVREKAAQKVFNRIGEVRKARPARPPIFGVMGCVAQLEGTSLFDGGSPIRLVAGTRATDRLPELIQSLAQGADRVSDLGERKEGEVWDVSPAERRSPYVAFVPIIEGCNKFCTYCIVPFSRGRERSRYASEIVAEVAALKSHGYKEIHLIGQNVNSYRPSGDSGLEEMNGATPFSRLLRAVAATGIERIKFTTSFPRDFHSDIVAAIEENSNICEWIHLPVQSGSNRVLKAMRRGYTVERYLEKVDVVKQSERRMSLTTDIIVGFPGETLEDFNATLNLVKSCEYDSLYAFKYSVRSGTRATLLNDDISNEEKTRRLIELVELQKGLQRRTYQGLVGQRLKVLVEGTSAKSAEDLTGHSTCHKVVNFAGSTSLLGQIVDVLITTAKENSLYGRLVA